MNESEAHLGLGGNRADDYPMASLEALYERNQATPEQRRKVEAYRKEQQRLRDKGQRITNALGASAAQQVPLDIARSRGEPVDTDEAIARRMAKKEIHNRLF